VDLQFGLLDLDATRVGDRAEPQSLAIDLV
jgi:hypothetical protein